MRRTLSTLSVLLATVVISAQTRPEATVIAWIRSTAIPLDTVEAGRGFTDMQRLRRIVGNARIVSLGEATHGTREFFQLKHRLLEFLATEMRFDIFSIEANLPEAYRLNDFVLTGAGDPRQLLRGMYFWTWDTEEVLDMILWMRRFNESGRGRLQFTGFDMQTPTVAMDIVRAFVERYDPAYRAALVRATDEVRGLTSAPSFGVATATFPLPVAAGKRVRYSGYIKTTGITRGWAGLWWRVDGETGVLAFDNMQDRGVTGTTDWIRYQIELPVAANARNINFGALHTGDGSAWFDGLTIELDGVPYTDQSVIDLDFESAPPRGFFTGGAGYAVQVDREVFRSGRQSLRMTYVGGAPTTGPDPARVASTWKEVVRYLQSNRAAYRANGATDREIEWAARNATVVLQGVQLRTNEVSRDRSMADNVKWILDQSPGAKIVLWAHNGHVATGGLGFETMGSSLRKMFGAEMVVFGFAFNQGAFQAMGRPTGLSAFSVPPAPAGSLDATLAAARVPVFALDWRQSPQFGLIGAWINEPHKTRMIGAVYREEAPDNFWVNLRARDAFDVTLFVDRTSAARSNPAR